MPRKADIDLDPARTNFQRTFSNNPPLTAQDRVGLWLLRLCYDLVFVSIMILCSPYFLYMLATTSRFRTGIFQRFGKIPTRSSDRPFLWVHGVSVGETKASRPFVEEFQKRHPEAEIGISQTTETGHSLAKKLFPHSTLFFYPMDFSPVVRRFFQRIRPSAIILMELEIWPNLLLEARKRRIPVFVVNGRLTERSFRGYRRLRYLLPQFRWIEMYGVQNEIFARRFRELGVAPERILVTGNVKFDEVTLTSQRPKDAVLSQRLQLRSNERVLVGGSTHDTEEVALYETVLALKKQGLETIRLIVAPRHPNRALEVVSSIQALGGKAVRFSQIESDSKLEAHAVIVVDAIGELEKFYSLGDLVFVGGSLIPRGGHNVLEPAAMGKAVVVGPHTFNFESEVALLEEGDAMVQVAGSQALAEAMKKLLEDPKLCLQMGEKALALIRQSQGATLRTVEAVDKRLFGS